MFCVMCGSRVPANRRKPTGKGKSAYAHLFCKDACFTKYADQMIGMARESELEVQEDIKEEIRSGQGPWSELLANLDEAAATATANAERPQEIAARFLGAFAGKFAGKMATKAYSSFVDGVKAWGKAKEEAAKEQGQNGQQRPGAQKPQTPQAGAQKPQAPQGQAPAWATPTGAPSGSKPGTPPGPKPSPQPGAPGQGQPGPRPAGSQQGSQQQKPPSANGQPTPPSTPPPQAPKREWKNVKEPEDLEDRSLEEQRVWLLRRFYLPPSATREELEAKYKAVMRRFHPDNRLTGDPKIATIVNATKQRLDEIERELAPKKRRR